MLGVSVEFGEIQLVFEGSGGVFLLLGEELPSAGSDDAVTPESSHGAEEFVEAVVGDVADVGGFCGIFCDVLDCPGLAADGADVADF